MSSGFAFRRHTPKRSAAWHFEQRRLRRDRRMGYVGHPLRVGQIAHRDNLFECFRQLLREGGPAAGVDGLHAADLSPSEAGDYMGVLSKCVLDGTYRPQDVRPVAIPKPGTGEYRTLRIGTLADRVVGRALHNAFTPLWEKRFLPCSYGFRPRRSTWTLLADLEVSMEKQGRWVLAIADIRKAFDNVPNTRVVELHRQALDRLRQQNFSPTDKLFTVALVEHVLRGHDHTRTRGIDQGGPYSPTALNVLLHHMLDVPLSKHVGTKPPRYYRYADNLCYLAGSVTDGGQVLKRISQLLQPLGLTLKAGAEVVDLCTGGTAQLLGFTLRQGGGRLRYGVGPAAWDNLRQHLGQAHVTSDPPTAARLAVLGWVESLGPAFESGDVAKVLSAATQYGFREMSPEEVQTRWENSWERWKRVRQRARRRNRGGG
jgi:RNA-directed DNA polymerase